MKKIMTLLLFLMTIGLLAGGAYCWHQRMRIEAMMGTFSGVLPCADCPGIETTLVLGQKQYQLTSVYEDRHTRFTSKGTWTLSLTKPIIRFSNPDDNAWYVVDENTLEMLDKDGNRVQSALNYQLNRTL